MQRAALLISAVQLFAYSILKFCNGLGFLLLSLTVRMGAGDLFWFSLALAVLIAFSAIGTCRKPCLNGKQDKNSSGKALESKTKII